MDKDRKLPDDEHIYIYFYSKLHVSQHFKYPHRWMTTGLLVIIKASTAVGDNQMLQWLVSEAGTTWEPESIGLCSNSLSSELWVLGQIT